MFGRDINKFGTIASSFNVGFAILMGEFEWYDNSIGAEAYLPSGVPRSLLVLWFISYMFFVLTVFLNMILVIVLENYTVVAKIMTSRTDARTLWSQTYRYIVRRR